MKLQGKNVVIPGASRPIGRAIARLFAREGATLFLPVYDWPESISEMKKEFRKNGFSFFCKKVDLRKDRKVKAFVHFIQEQTETLHILINNIERGGMPVVHGDYSHPHNKDQWQLEIDTCINAKRLLFEHCLPLLQNAKQSSIVNISSIAGEVGRCGSAAPFFSDGYSVANRAISSLTENWARRAAPKTRVNELCIGFIRSRHGQGTRGWGALTTEEKQGLKGDILLGRTGLPEEVAAGVFFLAIEASYVNGSRLVMDGGYLQGARKVQTMPPGIL